MARCGYISQTKPHRKGEIIAAGHAWLIPPELCSLPMHGGWKASSKICTQNKGTCAEGQKYYLYNVTVQASMLSAADCCQMAFCGGMSST